MNKTIIFSLLGVAVAGIAIFSILNNDNAIPPVTAENSSATNSQTAVSDVKEFKIDAYKYYFEPNVITVKKGDKVKITINNADALHGIRIPELGLAGNETIEFTADKEGEFAWYCNTYCGDGHAGMQGKLIVQAN